MRAGKCISSASYAAADIRAGKEDPAGGAGIRSGKRTIYGASIRSGKRTIYGAGIRSGFEQ